MNFLSPISMQGGYTVRIYSDTQKNGLDKIAIEVNEYFLLINPKNKNAQAAIENWHNNEYRSDIHMKAKLQALEKLIDNGQLFDVVDNQKEAYLEFLRISDKSWRGVFKNFPPSKYPLRPEKSFDLLKDWYFEVLAIDKAEFLRLSMDNGPEVLYTFEIDVINRLLDGINNTLQDTKSFIKKSDREKIAIQTFKKWLTERRDALEANKTFTENEDSALADIENWSKKIRTYFLLELGIDQLPLFKQAGQNDKYRIIANILNCSTRRAREYYNHSKETVNIDEKQSVLDLLGKITRR